MGVFSHCSRRFSLCKHFMEMKLSGLDLPSATPENFLTPPANPFRGKQNQLSPRAREAQERLLEKERLLEQEQLLEQERLERERLDRERLERERLLERERVVEAERERLERERLERERLERERLKLERLEQERLERERLERVRTQERSERPASKQERRGERQKEAPAALSMDAEEHPRRLAKAEPASVESSGPDGAVRGS